MKIEIGRIKNRAMYISLDEDIRSRIAHRAFSPRYPPVGQFTQWRHLDQMLKDPDISKYLKTEGQRIIGDCYMDYRREGRFNAPASIELSYPHRDRPVGRIMTRSGAIKGTLLITCEFRIERHGGEWCLAILNLYPGPFDARRREMPPARLDRCA